MYAPSTAGILLREFSFGHANQLAAVAREHLIALAARTPLLAGADERMFIGLAAAPGLRAPQTRRLVRARQDRRARCCAKGCLR